VALLKSSGIDVSNSNCRDLATISDTRFPGREKTNPIKNLGRALFVHKYERRVARTNRGRNFNIER
jgi:hypothetical protein